MKTYRPTHIFTGPPKIPFLNFCLRHYIILGTITLGTLGT